VKEDFKMLRSWVDNPAILYQFAGPLFSYPLTDSQLCEYVETPDIQPFKIVFTDTNEHIGHCELNLTNGQNRLSRILIGRKDLRGQRIGQRAVEIMAAMLFEKPEVMAIDLNTFDWNKAAICCYKRVGFQINEEATEPMIVKDQVWTKLNLVLHRAVFEARNSPI
ncbi:MAG: GNAT family protein, partial [Bacteroidota bacterium]